MKLKREINQVEQRDHKVKNLNLVKKGLKGLRIHHAVDKDDCDILCQYILISYYKCISLSI